MLKIYDPAIWNIYHPILTLTEMSLTVQLWFDQSVQTHDTIFSLLPFATTPVKSRSTQIKPRIKGQPPCWNSANIQYTWIWWNAAPAQRTQQWGCLPHLHIMRHPRIEIHVEIASNNTYTQESVLCLSIVVKTKIDNKWEHIVSILKTSRGHLENVFKTSVDTWEHLENIWNIWERL